VSFKAVWNIRAAARAIFLADDVAVVDDDAISGVDFSMMRFSLFVFFFFALRARRRFGKLFFLEKRHKKKVKTKKHDGQRRRKERRQRRTHQLESEGPGARRRCFFSLVLLLLLLCFPRFVLRARSFEREREREKTLFFFFQNSRGDLLNLSRAYNLFSLLLSDAIRSLPLPALAKNNRTTPRCTSR